MSNIKPTVGRVVWFTPSENDDEIKNPAGPRAAIITYVWSDSCVNLAVFAANGSTHGRTSVPLVQDDEPRLSDFFCEWMPYQKGQAAKTEALEAKLGSFAADPRKPVQDSEIPNRAPRVTPADIEGVIAHEFYFHPHDALIDAARFEFLTRDHDDTNLRTVLGELMKRMPVMSTASVRADIDALMGIRPEPHEALKVLTFCVLVLKNGFTVTGESACASPENFNAEIGRKIARQHAVDKIWPLLGYELRTKLSGG